MSSEDLKNLSETAFNYAKILGLAAAGFWTWYQWDRVIFPKESYEAVAKKAARRTDLTTRISEIRVDLTRIPELESKISSLPVDNSDTIASSFSHEEPQNNLIGISGRIEFKNDRDFPISLRIDSVKIVFSELDVKKDTKNFTKITTKNHIVHDIEVDDLFGGAFEDEERIIETNGDINLSFSSYFFLRDRHNIKRKQVEIYIQYNINAIETNTNEIIPGSSKNKIIHARSFLSDRHFTSTQLERRAPSSDFPFDLPNQD